MIHELKESKRLYVFNYDEVLPSLAEASSKYDVCLLVCKEEISNDFLINLVESVVNLGTKYIVVRGRNSESIHDEIDIHIEDSSNVENVITTYHESDESDEEVSNFVLNAIGAGKGSNILMIVDEKSNNLINELINL